MLRALLHLQNKTLKQPAVEFEIKKSLLADTPFNLTT